MTTQDPILAAFNYAADLLDPPDRTWRPQTHQLPPDGDWFGWMFLGGRGTGKTATDSAYVYEHVQGPPCDPKLPGGHWIGIIAPTKDDAVTSCIEGPSGLKQHDAGLRLRVGPGGTLAHFSNGSVAKLFGASTPEDVERLRSGGNRCLYWFEEMAAWRYLNDCYAHARYGLRLGPHPHWVASTTPKPHLLIRWLVYRDMIDKGIELNKAQAQKYGEVCNLLGFPATPKPAPARESIKVTRASTEDNKKLPDHIRSMLYQDYGGTRLGRQELHAEILEDIDGALWNALIIDLWRVPMGEAPTNFSRVTVGVDPPGKAMGDEAGIVVVARLDKWPGNYFGKAYQRAEHPHGFVLADYTIRGGPEKWAKAAIKAFDDWGANYVVAETNNGHDMVKHTLLTYRPTLPVKEVHASRGKAKRAEPVAMLYEQGRMHHVGEFPRLEDQMTTWDADDPPEDWSPDRMDALVWATSDLLVGRTTTTTTRSRDVRLRHRR